MLFVVSLNKLTIKTVKEANIEDNDEYLKIKEITNHVKINNNPYSKVTANKIPRYVATPLPPLNLSHIGNTCPKKHNKQEILI